MTRVAVLLTALTAGLLGGCERPAAPEQARRPAAARQDHEFVVFAEPRLVIGRLGAPVPAPVTVGSLPSPATIASDDPGVVSIDEVGALVAHREGTVTIRALNASSTLVVDVVLPRGKEQRGSARR